MDMRPETIAAISTPTGRGGIGIIRISGDNAFTIARHISKTSFNWSSIKDSPVRKLIHGYLINEKNEKIDEVLMAIMPANKSYTGEPTVEINCHGGRAVLAAALDLIVSKGARVANPGEYTRRAVENGRIDLVQAEAINDLINARSEMALKMALRQMEGGLTTRCKGLREKLLNILTEIQAQVDFEVEDSLLETDQWGRHLKSIEQTLEEMLKSSKIRKFIDHGVWIALTGAPNAGKSSLFNAILNVERSIVCHVPGTTRDHISETIEIEGIEVKLTDTAGIRKTTDEIEEISIDRSRQQIESADIVIYIIDQSIPLDKDEEQYILSILDKNSLLLLNKSDKNRHHRVKEFIDRNKIEYTTISAIQNEGIDELLDIIAQRIVSHIDRKENAVVATLRQNNLLEEALSHVKLAGTTLLGKMEIDKVTYEIEISINKLIEIVGEIKNEEIYEEIFNKFCVGK